MATRPRAELEWLWLALGFEGPCPDDLDYAQAAITYALRAARHHRGAQALDLGRAEDPVNDPANGVSVSRGKWTLRAKGPYAVGAIVLAILLYLGWRESDRFNSTAEKRTSDAVSLLTRQHDAILSTARKTLEELEIQSYLQSLPIEDRPRLIPPETLTERLERMPPTRRRLR